MSMLTRTGQIGLCAIFGFLSLAPALFWPAGVAMNSQLNENRVKAALSCPEPNIESLFRFASEFRRFFNDHFPFRDLAIQSDAALRLNLAGNRWTDRVLIGTENWLFLRRTIQGTPVTLPVAEYTPNELQQWVSVLQQRHDWLQSHGIRYALVIAPDKAAIYPDKRPQEFSGITPDTRQTQLFNRLASDGIIQFVDLRPALTTARTQFPELYYRTDTHWNAVGGWIATQSICRQLQLPFIFGPVDEGITGCENPIYRGDLLRLLGAPHYSHEPRITHLPKRRFTWTRTALNEQPHILCPEYALPFATETPHTDRPRAVIFRDSFTLELQPFLSEAFSRAVYVWDYKMDQERILQESPDLVIDIFVERQLNTAPPSAFSKSYRSDVAADPSAVVR
jgi:alginate O-acetyltransferase complex protein AlgJ